MFYHFCVDICTLGLRTWHCKRFAPFPGSKARSNKFYIWRQCTYVVYVGSVRVIAKWKKNWSKIDNKCKKEELFCKEINCKLSQIQRSRYTIAFHRRKKPSQRCIKIVSTLRLCHVPAGKWPTTKFVYLFIVLCTWSTYH